VKPITQIVAGIVFAIVSPACAADICDAVALRDIPAAEAPSSILKRGEHDGAITQYRVNKKTGLGKFCSHGGYCYEATVTENGKTVETLRLTNCKIGARGTYDDPDDVYYSVDVIRSKISPLRLKIDDLDNRLLELGLCSACAGGYAYQYVDKPTSPCSKLIRQALEGNLESLQSLKEGPDYCKSWRPPIMPLPPE